MGQVAVVMIAGLALLACLWAAGRLARQRAQQARLRAVLDAADALEVRLRDARTSSGIHAAVFDDVMREVLNQRLWLQEHGLAANSMKLDQILAALGSARARLDQLVPGAAP